MFKLFMKNLSIQSSKCLFAKQKLHKNINKSSVKTLLPVKMHVNIIYTVYTCNHADNQYAFSQYNIHDIYM